LVCGLSFFLFLFLFYSFLSTKKRTKHPQITAGNILKKVVTTSTERFTKGCFLSGIKLTPLTLWHTLLGHPLQGTCSTCSSWRPLRTHSVHGKTLKQVFEVAPLLNDNAGRDLSPKRMLALNNVLATTLPHPSTIYIACIARAIVSAVLHRESFHLPSTALLLSFPENLVLVPLSLFLGFFGEVMHATCGVPFMEHKHAAHLMSDGMVSVAGQRHPLFEPVVAETFTSFETSPKRSNQVFGFTSTCPRAGTTWKP